MAATDLEDSHTLDQWRMLAAVVMFLLCCADTRAERVESLVLKGIALQPGQEYDYRFPANERTEIFWRATQQQPCSEDCVKATRLYNNGDSHFMSTRFGGGQLYEPESGEIRVIYKNISAIPVVIDLYSVRSICDATACAILRSAGVNHPEYPVSDWENTSYRQLRVAAFDSIETAEDQSYSRIKGITVFGEPFDVLVVMWRVNRAFDGHGVGMLDRLKREHGNGDFTFMLSGGTINMADKTIMVPESYDGKVTLSAKTPEDLGSETVQVSDAPPANTAKPADVQSDVHLLSWEISESSAGKLLLSVQYRNDGLQQPSGIWMGATAYNAKSASPENTYSPADVEPGTHVAKIPVTWDATTPEHHCVDRVRLFVYTSKKTFQEVDLANPGCTNEAQP